MTRVTQHLNHSLGRQTVQNMKQKICRLKNSSLNQRSENNDSRQMGRGRGYQTKPLLLLRIQISASIEYPPLQPDFHSHGPLMFQTVLCWTFTLNAIRSQVKFIRLSCLLIPKIDQLESNRDLQIKKGIPNFMDRIEIHIAFGHDPWALWFNKNIGLTEPEIVRL